MSLTNDVRLVGYCAAKPVLTRTKSGKIMAILVLYTRDYVSHEQYTSQAHRCISFGKSATYISKKGEKGKHIYVRGTLRSKRIGEGKDAHYYTNILIEDFQFTPVQGMLALKDTIKDILEAENITSCDELDLFHGDSTGNLL